VNCYRAKPVVEYMPGWKCDIRGIRTFDELPEEARAYINRIQELIECPVTMISNGPGREDMIFRK
jgi:adenylosuccinate synthase